MNFDELDKWEDFAETNGSDNPYKEQFLEFITYEDLRKEALKKPFEYLFSDIINPNLLTHLFKEQFESYPADYSIYEVLNDDSKCCIALCPKMINISPDIFPNWIDNVLKVADHLILYYIQNFIKEEPVKYPNHGVETSRYLQVETFDCNDIRTAGQKLKYIYENRNIHAHRTHYNGSKHILPKVNRNKIRYNCMKEIVTGYKRLQSAFSKAYPKYVSI